MGDEAKPDANRFYTTAPLLTHGRNMRLTGCASRSGIRASDNRVETPSRTSTRAFANYESACLQRETTCRYSDFRTSTFRDRVKAAAEAKKPARNLRATGRVWAAWNWNDGTYEKVDPSGITGLGIETRYPRKLISALQRDSPETSLMCWNLAFSPPSCESSKASD